MTFADDPKLATLRLGQKACVCNAGSNVTNVRYGPSSQDYGVILPPEEQADRRQEWGTYVFDSFWLNVASYDGDLMAGYKCASCSNTTFKGVILL